MCPAAIGCLNLELTREFLAAVLDVALDRSILVIFLKELAFKGVFDDSFYLKRKEEPINYFKINTFSAKLLFKQL